MNFLLHIKFIFKLINTTLTYVQKIKYPIFICATNFLQYTIRYIRCQKSFFVKMDAITFYLFARQRHCKIESSQQSPYGMSWNFPYSEKSQNMINSISVKIVCHIGKTTFPPRKSVLSHFLPIVRRKSPILTFYREIIGRSTCLFVKMKQIRLHPRINTVPADSNRQISFQYNSFGMCIFTHFLPLLRYIILHKIITANYFRILLRKLANRFCHKHRQVFPKMKN